MLIRFGVENHLSIKSAQELSLVASALKDGGVDLIKPTDNLSLLPATLIYGANASGKSNLVSALANFVDTVRNSHAQRSPTDGVPRFPFRLDETSALAPSKFDIDFVIDQTRFHYGYTASDREFLEEWLFAYPSGKKQTWFLRERNKKKIYFGKSLKGSLRTIESLIRPNSLFLSAAAQNSHKQLTPLYQYICSFSVLEPRSGDKDAKGQFLEGKIDPRIIDFLKQADTGIVDYHFDDYRQDEKTAAIMSDIFDVMKTHAKVGKDFPSLRDIKLKIISLGHQTEGRGKIYLDMAFESTGTIRLLQILKSVYFALDRGSVVVIDELDSSLHTYLSEKIVFLFNSKETNPKGAQLIATTHDTNLLSADMVRRDQIWFAEKNKSGATEFYPLTDIRTRNTDNLEKGYLEGRFGAVPYNGSVKLLVGNR
jgi:AAA15 family ATPase/GTPase